MLDAACTPADSWKEDRRPREGGATPKAWLRAPLQLPAGHLLFCPAGASAGSRTRMLGDGARPAPPASTPQHQPSRPRTRHGVRMRATPVRARLSSGRREDGSGGAPPPPCWRLGRVRRRAAPRATASRCRGCGIALVRELGARGGWMTQCACRQVRLTGVFRYWRPLWRGSVGQDTRQRRGGSALRTRDAGHPSALHAWGRHRRVGTRAEVARVHGARVLSRGGKKAEARAPRPGEARAALRAARQGRRRRLEDGVRCRVEGVDAPRPQKPRAPSQTLPVPPPRLHARPARPPPSPKALGGLTP